MKHLSKILCVALLLTLGVSVQGQTIGRGSSAGLRSAPTSIDVSETDMGWYIRFAGMGSAETVGLVFGRGPGRTAVDLGAWGGVILDVTDIALAMIAGTSTPEGDLFLFVPRPKALPPELEGTLFFIQAISLDLNQAPPVKTSNVTKSPVDFLTLKSLAAF